MDYEQLVPAVLQLPFLAIFVWFAMKLLADFRNDAKERDASWQRFMEAERKFEALQSRQLTHSMQRIADGISSLGQIMTAHDAKVEERHFQLLRELGIHVPVEPRKTES